MPRLLILIALLLTSAEFVSGQHVPHVQRGEFGAATEQAMQLPPQDRDVALAEIVLAQRASGDPTSAASTLRQIESPDARTRATRGVDGAVDGGAGGGSFADFDSLIQLIQNTVDPESWDTLGGEGTVQQYPQGVYVDPSGTLQACDTVPVSDAMGKLAALLARQDSKRSSENGSTDWRSPAELRCVSLRRLRDTWAEAQLHGGIPGESLSHLAGLSSIDYVVFQDDDVLILGKTHGIESHQGWFRDRTTGLAAIRLDVLATTIASATGQGPFGCTIDPTGDGLRAAATTAAKIQADQVPIGKAAEAMVSAMGMQTIEVFGTTDDSPLALMMVEADRHMKQLALGIHPMPGETPNYLDIVDEHIAQGVPNNLLLRLWFTANPRTVRADKDQTVFEMRGVPVRLSGENERAMANGARGNLTTDFRSEAFVERFNQNWSDIRARYPIYAGLESIYQASSVAALSDQFASTPAQRSLLASIAAMASTSRTGTNMRVPRQVETIAVMHSVRHGRKRHHIVMASGGVAVNPIQTLTAKIESYPSLKSMTSASQDRPDVIQRWWWDVR